MSDVLSILSDELRNEFEYIVKSNDKNLEKKFLKKVKGNVSSSDFKKIKKLFKKSMSKEEEILEVGPIIDKSEIHDMKKRLHDFVKSPDFNYHNYISSKEKIRFFLFGSLVTGISSSKSKMPNTPVDKGRISDVDLGIIISEDFFDTFVTTQYTKMKGTKRSFPMSKGDREVGPFKDVFDYVSKLRIAGKKNREVNVVFMSKSFFLNFNLRKEPHIRIFQTWIK